MSMLGFGFELRGEVEFEQADRKNFSVCGDRTASGGGCSTNQSVRNGSVACPG